MKPQEMECCRSKRTLKGHNVPKELWKSDVGDFAGPGEGYQLWVILVGMEVSLSYPWLWWAWATVQVLTGGLEVEVEEMGTFLIVICLEKAVIALRLMAEPFQVRDFLCGQSAQGFNSSYTYNVTDWGQNLRRVKHTRPKPKLDLSKQISSFCPKFPSKSQKANTVYLPSSSSSSSFPLLFFRVKKNKKQKKQRSWIL